MTLSFELLLVLGALGIYLFDSALLLSSNELVIAGGGWNFILPGARWRWMRKRLYLPGPLTPGLPLFRVAWYGAELAKPDVAAGAMREKEAALRPLAWFTPLLLALLAVGLPWSLLILRSPVMFLWLLALVYPLIVLMLVLVFRRAGALGLNRRECWKIAFDCLACAPLAVNAVRRISLAQTHAADPLRLAEALCTPAELAGLHAHLDAHIEQLLEEVDEQSASYRELINYRRRLKVDA